MGCDIHRAHQCPNFNSNLAEPAPRLGHGCVNVITYPCPDINTGLANLCNVCNINHCGAETKIFWRNSITLYHACWFPHDDVIKWKHFPRYWPFVQGIYRSPVNSPHKGQWRGALMFSLICVWINGWVNNREAGDLRRHRAHYDVIVMWYGSLPGHQQPWYWLGYTGPLPSLRKYINNQCLLRVKKWWKMPLCFPKWAELLIVTWTKMAAFVQPLSSSAFLTENVCIFIQISLEFVPLRPIDF